MRYNDTECYDYWWTKKLGRYYGIFHLAWKKWMLNKYLSLYLLKSKLITLPRSVSVVVLYPFFSVWRYYVWRLLHIHVGWHTAMILHDTSFAHIFLEFLDNKTHAVFFFFLYTFTSIMSCHKYKGSSLSVYMLFFYYWYFLMSISLKNRVWRIFSKIFTRKQNYYVKNIILKKFLTSKNIC